MLSIDRASLQQKTNDILLNKESLNIKHGSFIIKTDILPHCLSTQFENCVSVPVYWSIYRTMYLQHIVLWVVGVR